MVVVEDDAGETHHCLVRKRLGRIVCGDRVRWRPTADGQGLVVDLAPRHNLLSRPDPSGRPRPLAANIDRVVIVVAPEPPFQPGLVDRYLVAVENLGSEALLLLNKTDLLSPEALAAQLRTLDAFRALGYDLIHLSAHQPASLPPLVAKLAGSTAILVGQSGVGKSSLVAALVPDLDIRIHQLSAASGQGRHTTTETTLYHLPDGGALIDSPGVRDFQLWHLDPAALVRGFREIAALAPHCRFRDCRHEGEPGCAVAEAARAGRISDRRLESYRALRRQRE